MTWYRNNNIFKESMNGVYGEWLSPDGDSFQVPLNGHTETARNIIKSLGERIPYRMTPDDLLLSKGYAKLTFMGGLSVYHHLGLTSQQLKKIIALFNAEKKTRNNANILINNPEYSDVYVDDPYEAYNYLSLSKVTSANLNYNILKLSEHFYGYWFSPTGQIYPVRRDMGHHKTAVEILLKMGEDFSKDLSPGSELLERGWAKTAYGYDEMDIDSIMPLTSSQILEITRLADNAPRSIELYRVSVNGKNQYIMRHQLDRLKLILEGKNIRVRSYSSKNIKTAKSDTSGIDNFLKQEESISVNPKNQLGSYSTLYDVQRYVMDSYSIKTSISKTKNKITVGIFVNHAFLGSLAFNKYWTFEFSEWKKAIDLYKNINKISEKTIEDFIEEEITTTIFWPVLKHKLDSIEPDRIAACNIPWVNYSRYYTEDENPDWRQNIYGNRYPVYSEPSYSQEIKRKNVFFD